MREVIERGCLAGQLPGTSARQWGDERPQLNTPGGHRHCCQSNPWISYRQGPIRTNVIPEEEAIPSRVLRLFRQLGQQAWFTVVAEIRSIDCKKHLLAPCYSSPDATQVRPSCFQHTMARSHSSHNSLAFSSRMLTTSRATPAI